MLVFKISPLHTSLQKNLRTWKTSEVITFLTSNNSHVKSTWWLSGCRSFRRIRRWKQMSGAWRIQHYQKQKPRQFPRHPQYTSVSSWFHRGTQWSKTAVSKSESVQQGRKRANNSGERQRWIRMGPTQVALCCLVQNHLFKRQVLVLPEVSGIGLDSSRQNLIIY
jgi:hypothetical protein